MHRDKDRYFSPLLSSSTFTFLIQRLVYVMHCFKSKSMVINEITNFFLGFPSFNDKKKRRARTQYNSQFSPICTETELLSLESLP